MALEQGGHLLAGQPSVHATSSKKMFSVPLQRAAWRQAWEALLGYGLIAPALVLITLFGLLPMGYAVYMSLYDWRVRRGAFIGLDNYRVIMGDGSGLLLWGAAWLTMLCICWLLPRVWRAPWRLRIASLLALALLLGVALWGSKTGWHQMLATATERRLLQALPVTVFYALGSIPLQLACGLALALLLFQRFRGLALFRTIFFLPYVMPTIATAMVFRLLFSARETSVANQILAVFGIAPLQWLAEPRPLLEVLFGLHIPILDGGPSLALVTIMLFGLWTYVGYNVVIFLAGLSTIPPELYEAGQLDGAGSWALLRYITLPLLSPVTFYLAMIGFIGALKTFNAIYAMRLPLAQNTVDTVSVVVFDSFYKANQYGIAAAQALVLFVLILGVTYGQQRLLREKVFFYGES